MAMKNQKIKGQLETLDAYKLQILLHATELEKARKETAEQREAYLLVTFQQSKLQLEILEKNNTIS